MQRPCKKNKKIEIKQICCLHQLPQTEKPRKPTLISQTAPPAAAAAAA